jgi:hypothetical protein
MRVERNMNSISEHEYYSLSLLSRQPFFSFQNRYSEDIINYQCLEYSDSPIRTTRARFKVFSVKDVYDDFPFSGYDRIAYVIDLYASSPDATRIINFDDISYMSRCNLEKYSGLEND